MVFATQKMDEFLAASYATEETIKSALKECQRNINLPRDLTASIKHAAKKNASKLDA